MSPGHFSRFSPSHRDDTSTSLSGVRCSAKQQKSAHARVHISAARSAICFVPPPGARGRIPGAGDEEEIWPDERGSLLRIPCDVPTCVCVATCRNVGEIDPVFVTSAGGWETVGAASGVHEPRPSEVRQVVSLRT